MKDLKAFMAKVSEDQGLAKKVMAAKDTAEVVSIAAAAGYKFTEDDLMDEQMSQVAGGFSFSLTSILNDVNKVTQCINNGAAAVNGVVNAGANVINAVAGAGSQAASSIVQTGSQALDSITQTGSQALGSIAQTGSQALNSITPN